MKRRARWGLWLLMCGSGLAVAAGWVAGSGPAPIPHPLPAWDPLRFAPGRFARTTGEGGALFRGAGALQATPTTERPAMQPTPAGDRLAAPPTVAPAERTQADEGAQVYWLNCQPCHGDIGQGLTDAVDDDWRKQYPVEDQNCWESRCHGERPYENGFTLPRTVPAVIGPEALARFASAADVQRYVSQTMPFHAPGSLSEVEYWALTAFLLRANALPETAGQLDADSAAVLALHGALATATPLPAAGPGAEQVAGLALGAAAAAALAAGVGAWAWRRRRILNPPRV